VGRIFTNEYSRMGFLNWERNKDYYHKLIKEGNAQFDMPEGQTSADQDFHLVEDSAAFKVQKAKNETIVASNDTAAPLAKLFGDVADKAAELAQEFPKLTTAISGAYSAIQGLGAIGGAGLGGAVALGGKKLWSVLRGGSAVAAEGAEIAASGGIASRAGSVLSRAGGAIARGAHWAGGVLEDGLLTRGAGLVNPWTVGALALTPGSTVGNSSEMGELARLKQRNMQQNSAADVPVALDALNEMKNFMEQHNSVTSADAGGAAVSSAKASPAPVLNANFYLDGRALTDAVLRRVDVDSRRK